MIFQMSNIQIAILGGVLGMMGFGIADFLAKKAIDRIGSLKALIFTQIFGAFLLFFYFFSDHSMPVFNLKNILSITAFGFFNGISYLALYRSFELGKLSIVSPISSSYAILAALVSFLFFGETFSNLKILSLILVITGVIFTAIDPRGLKNGIDKKDLSKGVPEALLFLVICGVYVPLWDRFLEGSGWVVWVILVRLILAFFLIIYQKSILKKTISFKLNNIVYILLLVSFFEALGSVGNSWGLHASANTTSIVTAITSTYPLPTAILAFLFLKERLVPSQYMGIGLIVTGLLISPFA